MTVLGRKGDLQQLANVGGGSSIFLRLDAAGDESLFLKVIESHRAGTLAEAESIAGWLQAQGVRVVIARSRARLSDGRELWVYPYHAGRPPESGSADMAAIGMELGKLHVALARHPSVVAWKQLSDTRLCRLSDIREQLSDGALMAGPDPELLQTKARDRTIDFNPERYAAAGSRLPLHGDLNRFNILIDSSGCTFLDFEDVRHSVFPAIFDLATVYERISLASQPEEQPTSDLNWLLDAYGAVTGCRPDPKWVPEVLRALALRALCTLADIDPAGQDEQEWEKFFQLLMLAEAQREPNSGLNGAIGS